MRTRIVLGTLLFGVSIGCSRDHSITHGADGSPEWTRRLANAVPIGLPRDSAWAILERNGFHCRLDSAATASFWCDKESRGRFTIVRRHWRAFLAVQGGHIAAVQATTGLTGP